MHITIDRAALVGALKPITAVADRGSTIPILQCVRLQTKADAVVCTATNMEYELRRRAAAAVLRQGEACVHAGKLAEIATGMADGRIDLQIVDDGRLRVSAGRSRAHLPVWPAADFPAFLLPERGQAMTIDGAQITGAFDRVLFAASDEETRHYLCGVCIHRHGDGLRLVTTDGHRLSRTDIAITGGTLPLDAAIVPTRVCELIRKLVADAPGDVAMTLGGGKLVARIGDAQIAAKLIDGQFPDYVRVIPASTPIAVTVDRAALLAAVRRVRPASSDEKTRTVALEIVPGEGVMRLYAGSPGAADAMDEVDAAVAGSNAPILVGFNSAYVLDVLGAIGTDRVVMEMPRDAEVSPCVIRRPDSGPAEADALLTVLMPMRVGRIPDAMRIAADGARRAA